MRARFVLVGCLAVLSAAGIADAVAAPADQREGPVPKVAHPTQYTAGTHNKASSLAPHPTRRRVFGAPIQAPIVKHVTPRKKKPAPK